MATFSNQTKGTYVDRAGQFMLEPTDTNGTVAAGKTIVPRCVIQSITINETRSEGELPDGNSPYAADTYIDTEGTNIDIVVSSTDPYMDAWMRGSELKATTATDWFRAISEGVTLDENKQGTLAHTYASGTEGGTTGLIHVIGADGSKKTATIEGTQITVTDAQAGEVVLVTYDYTATSGSKIEREAMANYISAVLTATNTVVNIGRSARFATNIVIDQVVPAGDQSRSWQKDPSGGVTYSLKALAPRAGKKALKIMWADTVDTASAQN